MSKVIITVALNGSVPTKQMNPNTPITPDEIAESAKRCEDEGATELSNCLACPPGADTGGLQGQTSRTACQCGERAGASDYVSN